MNDEVPYCPDHKVKLVLREAKQGINRGQKFWGCPYFNKSNYTYTVPYRIKIKSEPSLKEKFLNQIKNKNGKISIVKILVSILMIPLYVIYVILHLVYPIRKNIR